MAGPKKQRKARIPKQPTVTVDAKLKIPRALKVPLPTEEQLQKLAKAFESDVVATLGISSNVMSTKYKQQVPPRSRAKR